MKNFNQSARSEATATQVDALTRCTGFLKRSLQAIDDAINGADVHVHCATAREGHDVSGKMAHTTQN